MQFVNHFIQSLNLIRVLHVKVKGLNLERNLTHILLKGLVRRILFMLRLSVCLAYFFHFLFCRDRSLKDTLRKTRFSHLLVVDELIENCCPLLVDFSNIVDISEEKLRWFLHLLEGSIRTRIISNGSSLEGSASIQAILEARKGTLYLLFLVFRESVRLDPIFRYFLIGLWLLFQFLSWLEPGSGILPLRVNAWLLLAESIAWHSLLLCNDLVGEVSVSWIFAIQKNTRLCESISVREGWTYLLA